MYYDYNDSLEALKKIQLVEQSVNDFQQAGDLKSKARSLEMLGDLYLILELDEVDKSLPVLKEALAIYNSINYPKLQGVYVLLGEYYFTIHEYAPALFNLLKALKICQSIKDSSMQLCQINNHLGMLYSYIDMQDMAVEYLNDALKTAFKYNDANAIFWVAMNLSLAYNNLNQPDLSLKVLDSIPVKIRLSLQISENASLSTAYLNTYLLLKQLDKARPYCGLAIKIADKNLAYSDHDRKARIYMFAANFYFLSNQYEKARYYIAKSNTFANVGNYAFAQIRNLELVYKLDSAQGNFRSAYKHLLQYKEKTDSVSSERKVKQFQVMNVEYDVEMKEDSIKSKNKDILLLTQKNNLQQANLRQASLIKNITIIGIILTFIIIGLLYRQYRQKQKSNHELEARQKEINQKNASLEILLKDKDTLIADKDLLLSEKDWLVKEIHHRVKNNLQMVISLLNAQSEFLNNAEWY